jgi:hypothetical protein
MKHLPLVPALLAATFLAACDSPALFEAPISEPGQVKYDERLIGSWYSFHFDNHGVWLLRIQPGEDEDQGRLDAFLSYTGFERQTYLSVAESFASEIDGKVYYNARIASIEGLDRTEEAGALEGMIFGAMEGFMIIRAEFDADEQVLLRILSETVPKERKLKTRNGAYAEGWFKNLYELPADELIALIRSTPEEALFNSYLGPFARVETGRPVVASAPPPPQ